MIRRISFLVLGLALALAVGIGLINSATASMPANRPVVPFAPAACGTPGPWSVVSPIPTPVFGAMVASDGTYAYAAGGYSFQSASATNQFARYDPVANTWTALAALPTADYDGAAVYANGKVYVFGGTDGGTVSNTTNIYDVATNAWSTGAPLPALREQMGIGYASGVVYIAGGSDSQSINPQSTLYAYNVAGNSWTTLAPMPQALVGPGSGVINGHLYIAGGRDAVVPNRTTVYDYNISTNSWTSAAPLPTGVDVPGSAVVGGSELVLFGGGNPFSDPQYWYTRPGQAPLTTNVTQVYDPVANSWSAGPSLNTARSFVGGTAVGNDLIAVGGFDGSTSLNSVEVSVVPCGPPTPTPTGTPPTPTNTAVGASATSTNTPTNTPTTPPASPTTPGNTPTTPANTPTTPPSPTTPPTQTPGGPSATTAPSDTPTIPPTAPPTITPGGPSVTPPAPSATATSLTPRPTPTSCTLTFTDVPPNSTFYQWIRCLACLGIINGYPDGTFRPNNNITRGQLSKIASNSAGFDDTPTGQQFQDVPPTGPGSTFYPYIYRLVIRGFINGYPCGGPGEPCIPPNNLPYFRPNTPVTRGQITKIISNAAGFTEPPTGQQFQDVPPGSTFYTYTYRLVSRQVMSGYPCGSPPAGPCIPPDNLPYFRPNNNATRGQTSKIDANTFFPDCNIPIRH